MKRILLSSTLCLLTFLSVRGAGLLPVDSAESVGVTIGDTTYLPSGNSIIRSGDTVIYQQQGRSSFSNVPGDRNPRFIQNDQGKVTPLSLPEKAKPIKQRPNPVNDNKPSPLAPAVQRPSFSSLPKTPFLRPSPAGR